MKLAKSQLIDNIEHKNDNKGSIAKRKVRELLYGRTSLYAREASVEGVKSITPEDAKQWLLAHQRACNQTFFFADKQAAFQLKRFAACSSAARACGMYITDVNENGLMRFALQLRQRAQDFLCRSGQCTAHAAGRRQS